MIQRQDPQDNVHLNILILDRGSISHVMNLEFNALSIRERERE